jgi:hypothetical protein
MATTTITTAATEAPTAAPALPPPSPPPLLLLSVCPSGVLFSSGDGVLVVVRSTIKV